MVMKGLDSTIFLNHLQRPRVDPFVLAMNRYEPINYYEFMTVIFNESLTGWDAQVNGVLNRRLIGVLSYQNLSHVRHAEMLQ